MIRLTSNRILSFLPPEALLVRRAFSRFTERSELQVGWSLIRSSEVQVVGSRMRRVKSYLIVVPKRAITTDPKELPESLDDAVEVTKARKAKKVKSASARLVETKEDEELKIESPPIKEHNLEIMREIAGDNDELFGTLRTAQMKIDIMSKIFSISVPMGEKEYTNYLKERPSYRKQFLTFLVIKALQKQKNKKEQTIEFRDIEIPNSKYDDPMCYHLFHNSMFLKIRQRTLRKLMYARTMTSVMYSPQIFIDCSYGRYMSKYEQKYLGKQIIACAAENFCSKDPYHIVVCNFDENSHLAEEIKSFSHSFYNEDYPITITTKSFTDLWPKENLVYLSPHAKNYLDKIDPNKRYIIGGFVDKTCTLPVSLAKAKENDIGIASFPLDKYLDWQQGKKSLCVNHAFSIMLNLKNYNNDWHKAFEIIPQRNFMPKSTVRHTGRKKSSVYESTKLVFNLGEHEWN